jgi:hypothetical protein
MFQGSDLVYNINCRAEEYLWIYSALPAKCLESNSIDATNVSFHILANFLIIMLYDAMYSNVKRDIPVGVVK